MSLDRAVSTVMTRRPISVRPEAGVRDALAVSREHGIQHLFAMESDNLVGVVCTCDLLRARSDARVSSCMKVPVVTVAGGATLRDAAALMRGRRVGCLPVTAGQLLVGVVTRGDLARAGVPDELMGGECASCGARHHLGRSGERGVPFCAECLECGERNGAELGAGD